MLYQRSSLRTTASPQAKAMLPMVSSHKPPTANDFRILRKYSFTSGSIPVLYSSIAQSSRVSEFQSSRVVVLRLRASHHLHLTFKLWNSETLELLQGTNKARKAVESPLKTLKSTLAAMPFTRSEE